MKDNFSKQAELYAKYRPVYPDALFDQLIEHVPSREHALDVATGNGQVAEKLASLFRKVDATDISQKQLSLAPVLSNVSYHLCAAESTGFPDDYFDLITVAQALHWFDFERFYREVNRIGKPKGLLAVWGYGLLKISEEADRLISDFYTEVIGPYWDEERKHIDLSYTSIPFPYDLLPLLPVQMEYHWTLNELEGYLNTWSSVQKYITQNHHNPVSELVNELSGTWEREVKRRVIFPVFIKAGKIEK